MAAPVWLRAAPVFQSASADKLCEFDILYCFSDEEGGWAVGEINEINTSERRKVTVESDRGLKDRLPANVTVHYKSDDDVILQRLSLDNYTRRALATRWAAGCYCPALRVPCVQRGPLPLHSHLHQ